MAQVLPVRVLFLAAIILGMAYSCAPVKTIDYLELGEKVKNILTLPSYEMVYKDISYVGRQEIFLGFIPAKDKRLLFSVQIRVRAGLDLTQGGIRIQPVPDSGTSKDTERPGLRVELPPAVILLVDADDKSFHEYFAYERGDKITRADWETQIALARKRIELDAIERGILVKAWDNAAGLVRNFLKVAGFNQVECVQIPAIATEQTKP